MSTDIYRNYFDNHVTIESSNEKQAICVTMDLQQHHFEKLIDCAIGIALAWPNLDEDHACIAFTNGPHSQDFFLHVYSSNHKHEIIGVNFSVSAGYLSAGIQVDWWDFAYLIERIVRE